MQHDLDIYIRARYTLLWVVTSEESRALAEIDQLAKEQRKPLYVWSATTGVVNPAIPTRWMRQRLVGPADRHHGGP